jgi:hypothetical protein
MTLKRESKYLNDFDWCVRMAKCGRHMNKFQFLTFSFRSKRLMDRLCCLVVGVPGYRFRGLGSIPETTIFFWEIVGLERGPLSLVSTIE